MQNCPVCNNSSAEPWLIVPNVLPSTSPPGVYRLYRCRDCDYGFTAPRPTPEQVRGFYPEDYYTHGATAGRTEVPRTSLADRLLRHLAWRRDRGSAMLDVLRRLGAGTPRICDVGCGGGKLLAAMRDEGAEVIGVEIDGKARDAARARGVTVLQGTAEELPPELEPGTFDIVTMSHVLEHCIDPIAGLSNVAGLLRHSGLLVVEVPNNECLGLKRSGIAWPWLDVPRHLNFFTQRSLSTICRRSGLQVEAVGFSGYLRQFTGQWAGWEEEQRRRYAAAPGGLEADPRIRRAPSRWSLLLTSALASDGEKYDSVRVVARRQG